MYAIVDIAGQQFKVEKDQKIFVHRLSGEEGTAVEFDKVLLVDNEGTVSVGAPVIENAKISAKILSHVKGDKVKVFKKKRNKVIIQDTNTLYYYHNRMEGYGLEKYI